MRNAPLTIDTTHLEAVDSRMISTMRLVLAFSALMIIYLDPSEPDRLVPITYTALILYTLYSLVLLILALRESALMQAMKKVAHWFDIAWYLILIALSSGTSSIFFFLFFFSILVASFRGGFSSGLKAVVVSSVLFTIIGFATAPAAPQFELNRFLLRPIYMLALGYMIAYWGGHEITLKRRLALLKEVTSLSNPRFGVDRTVGVILEGARAFYDANACALVMNDVDASRHLLWRADMHNSEGWPRPTQLADEMAREMLALPPEYAAIYHARSRGWFSSDAQYFAYDIRQNECRIEGKEACQKIATLLDAESLVTVPLRLRSEVVGRFFLISSRKRGFDRSDAGFLTQVMEQVVPVIENIRLVDKLASEAAEQERQRIARDIHDSIIQPYIGLQLGLAAIQQKIERDGASARDDISRLIELTNAGIADLRRYVRGLCETGEPEASLLPSVRRFAAKFSQATGISVRVDARSEIHVNDRLAAEVFQMITEALSNIRRHTGAKGATITLDCCDGLLRLDIENERGGEEAPRDFTPSSIRNRAEALGGRASVVRCEKATKVVVEIPL